MSTERFVVLGLAHVRAAWFVEVSRWATSGALPIEFVKCVSVDEVRSRLAGPRSCTHLMEILVPLASAAYQSLTEHRRGRPDTLDADGRPAKVDSCYAYAAHRGVVMRRWPAWFRAAPPGSEASPPLQTDRPASPE